MYVDVSRHKTKSGKIYERVLLRTSYRDKETGKVRHKTVLNISHLPKEEIEALKLALKHKGNLTQLVSVEEVGIKQGKRFGGVWTALQVARELGLDRSLGQTEAGKLALFQVIARLINQGSRLSAVRFAERHLACELLEIENLNEDKLYDNLDWLAKNQEKIEKKLYFRRYGKQPPNLFLYDVTSSYLEGEENELADWGYNRDKKKGKKQIVVGLLTGPDGMPVAVRVFRGNTVDAKTVSEQIRTLTENFGAKNVTIVGDRGMIKGPQIKELPDDFWYITAISKSQIRKMLDDGDIEYELFDSKVTEVEVEGIRYVLRRNPFRQSEMHHNRLMKFESLQNFVNARNEYLSQHPRAKAQTHLKYVQSRIEKLKIDKWVKAKIVDGRIVLERDEAALKEIEKLDGCYVIKSNVPKEHADAQELHDRYTDLEQIERDFRTIKQAHLELRPIFVRKESRTRGHVFVTMLALLIQRRLEKYWKDLNITVKEGLDELSALSVHTLTFRNATVNKIPEPSDMAQKLLEHASIEIPRLLPSFRAKIATKKKLNKSD